MSPPRYAHPIVKSLGELGSQLEMNVPAQIILDMSIRADR